MSLIPRKPVTLYIRHLNTLTGIVTPLRRILKHTVYTDFRADTAIRTGQVLSQAITIQVFLQDDLEYIPLEKWNKLPLDETDGYYSLIVGGTTNSVIVLGELEQEFKSGTVAQVTTAERDFVTANPNAFRIADFQDNITFSPTPMTAHLLVRA